MHEGLWIPTTNMWTGRNGAKPLWLILHGTACNGPCTAQGIAEYFRSTQGTTNPVSSHYIIGPDGTIVSCVDEQDTAWANGPITQGADWWWDNLPAPNTNPNYWTISIEHCKPDTANASPLTPIQQEASFALIQRICLRNNIPMSKANGQGGITGHFSIDPVNRARCPGNYPWDQLWAYLSPLSSGEQKSVDDEWNDSLVPLLPVKDSAIYKAWLSLALKGQHAGPLQGVKVSTDFNGGPITVYRFAYARGELDARGNVRWFDGRGEIG